MICSEQDTVARLLPLNMVHNAIRDRSRSVVKIVTIFLQFCLVLNAFEIFRLLKTPATFKPKLMPPYPHSLVTPPFHYLLNLLSPLRAWVHIRPQPEIATGFGHQLDVPGGPMSSLCPSSLFPPSSSLFLSDDLSFCGDQGSI